MSWLACLPSETPSHTLLLYRRTTAMDKLDKVGKKDVKGGDRTMEKEKASPARGEPKEKRKRPSREWIRKKRTEKRPTDKQRPMCVYFPFSFFLILQSLILSVSLRYEYFLVFEECAQRSTPCRVKKTKRATTSQRSDRVAGNFGIFRGLALLFRSFDEHKRILDRSIPRLEKQCGLDSSKRDSITPTETEAP